MDNYKVRTMVIAVRPAAILLCSLENARLWQERIVDNWVADSEEKSVFRKAGWFFGKAWPKSKTWRCQLWQFRTLAELGAKSIRTRVLLKSCMLSLKHMVRMCRTCHRPVQKISGKAKPCQRGIKLSFLLEFQVESLRCQSRRDMERCQKWKRLDKRNHTIVSQHHISFSTVF